MKDRKTAGWRCLAAVWLCAILLCSAATDTWGQSPRVAAADVEGALLIKGEPTSPGQASIVALMLAGTASQGEDETHAAHIAEHMVFQNRVESAPSLAERVADWGGMLNGHTGLEHTAFEITVPKEHALEALSELTAALFAFEYDPEVYQRELEGYLRVELHSMTTRYPTALHNAWRQHFFQGSVFAEDIFGVDITQVPQSTVADWHRREYGANRLVLAVNSEAGWEDIVKAASSALRGAPQAPPPASYQDARLSPPPMAAANIVGAPEGLVTLGLCVDGVDREDQADLLLLLELVKRQMRWGGSIMQLRALPELCLTAWQGGTAYLQLAWRPTGLRPQEPNPEAAQMGQLKEVVDQFAAGDIGPGHLRILRDDEDSAQVTSGVLQEAWALASDHLPAHIQGEIDYLQGMDPEVLLLRLQKVAMKYLPRAQLTTLQVGGPAPIRWAGALVIPAALLLFLAVSALLVRAIARRNHQLYVFLMLVVVTVKSAFRPGRSAGSEDNRSMESLRRLLAAILLFVLAFHLSELLVQICLQLGQPELLFILASTALAILLVFYGGYMLLSVFLWSKDQQLLLTLPLSSAQIVLARLLVVALSQYPLALLFLFPPVLKYSAYMRGQWGVWLAAIAVAMLLPIFTLTLVALPIVAAMRHITPRLRDRLTLLWSVLMALATISLRVQGGLRTDQSGMHSLIMRWLQLRQIDLTNTIGRIFPPAIWAGRAMASPGASEGLTSLGLLILASAVCLWLLYHLSLRCYLGGAEGENKSRQRRPAAAGSFWKAGTPRRALFLREWRTFWRTPALLAITLPNIFVPLVAFYPLLRIGFREMGLVGIAVWLRGDSGQSLLPALLAGAAAMLVALNSRLASISISREGSQLYFSKLIPLDYADQLRAKLLHVLAINGLCLTPLLVAAFIWLRLGLLSSLLALLAAALGLLVSSLICIRHDLSAPRLDWDNPQALLRGSSNLGSVLSMLLALAITVWLTFAMLHQGWPMLLIFLLVAGGYAAFSWLSYRSLLRQADQLYDDIPL